MADLVTIRRALISVSDKSELAPLARALAERGAEIISTGGTAGWLRAAGVAVTPVDAVTGFPEILGGRVKTLHPMVHGGLLGLRDDPGQAAQMREHGIRPIDLVCVNLYPFEKTVANPACTPEEAIENIDIGGPSMIRSAAKNFESVTVLTQPGQYGRVMEELSRFGGCTTRALRAELARAAFGATSRYDAAIAAYLEGQGGPANPFPSLLHVGAVKVEDTRYGENPHQRAAIYRLPGGEPGVAGAEQLHGKDLSYNNVADAAAAWDLARALARVGAGWGADGRAGACVIKHTNPCGAAVAQTPLRAVEMALAGDPLAAYGGILALAGTLDEPTARRLLDPDFYLEVVVAGGLTPAALEILRGKSANLRILAVGQEHATPARAMELRTISGGLLVQEKDTRLSNPADWAHHAGPAPTPEQVRCGAFLEAVGRALFSNAVVIGAGDPGGGLKMLGAGAGQMDRVTACRLATEKAAAGGDGPARGGPGGGGPGGGSGMVAYSDAFFPFDDGPRVLIDAGVRCLVHPGGSKRDAETFDLCRERGVTCLTTGVRHFRH